MEPLSYDLEPQLPEDATVRLLAENGKQYLLYINNWHPKRNKLTDTVNVPVSEILIPFELPAGNYKCEWIDPVSGERSAFQVRNHNGGEYRFKYSGLKEDLVLKITK